MDLLNLKILSQNPPQQAQNSPNAQILAEAYKDGLQAEYSLRACISKLVLIRDMPMNDLWNVIESLGRINQLNEKMNGGLNDTP
jgi:hypothetical protein